MKRLQIENSQTALWVSFAGAIIVFTISLKFKDIKLEALAEYASEVNDRVITLEKEVERLKQ